MTNSSTIEKTKSSLKIFSGLSSFQMLAMFRRGLFYTYLSIYMREFLNMSVFETTLYATIPMIMSIIFQNFVWGPISDKFQRRRTLIILGEILAGTGTITVWYIHFLLANAHTAGYGIKIGDVIFSSLYISGYVIIIGLSLVEMFWSMSNIGWSALLSDLYPSEKRSKIMGQLTSLGGLGRIIGIFIGGFLYDAGFGFRNGALFIIASFVMFISTIPMFFTPEGGVNIDLPEQENSLEITDNNQNHILIFIIFTMALIFINFGRNSIAVPYPQYLSLDSGFNVGSIMLSFIANMRSLATLVIGFTAGFLSKKFGHSRTLIVGTSIGIIGLIITATTIHLQLIFAGAFLIGAAEVIIYASSYAIASVLIPARMRGKLFAVYNTTFFLSWGIAGTFISGPLIDSLISEGKSEVFAYQMAFLTGALICLLGLFIFIALKIWIKIKKKSNPPNL
ncbi:MAG: MFS transporter [Candidatus Lokiarchaeota archaeon]|nr:MFS transporter [Candidatus Lokiarchaeota archaeon]